MGYKIVAFIGEAGSGKDKILNEYLSLSERKDLHEIISCTTRPKRESEIEGVNYYYLTNEEFAERILANEMIEASCFNGWTYGTCYENLRSDLINIGVFNPDGIRALLSHSDIDLLVIRVRASDKTRLLRQLNRENEPDVEEIIRRYTTDKIDFSILDFDYVELNNDKSIKQIRIPGHDIDDQMRIVDAWRSITT